MKYYLGVDSGGTRTRFLIINELGEKLGYYVNDTIHIHQVGEEETKKRFTSSIKEVCSLANIEIKSLSHAFLGLAGYGEVERDKIFIDKMTQKLLPIVTCGNDVHVAWAGSLAAQPGIQIVGGTGSIVYARNTQNQEARCGGWGYFFGDEGSAYWLSQLTLNLFSKQSDGRIPQGALLTIIRDYFKLESDFELIGCYQSQLLNDRTKIAALAPLLFQAVQQGDESAKKCIEQCAYEQALTIDTAMKKLEWDQDVINVSYSGGLFEAGETILLPLQKELTKMDTRLLLKEPVLSPILGASYYAYVLDNNGNHNLELIQQLKKIEI